LTVGLLISQLDQLLDAPGAIPRLRRFILDLAVRGDLVKQDPNETLSGRARRGPSSEYSHLTLPFPVPPSWELVRVREVAECRLGKMLDKDKNRGEPRPYLRNVNVRWFDFDLSDVLEMRFEESELEEFALRSGDVLVCEGGEPGRAAVWDERRTGIYFQKAIHRVRFSEEVEPHFFVKVLRAFADDGQLEAYFTGVGIKHFTGRGLASFLFPLPPAAEQRRIVAKVGELMGVCDQLDTRLDTIQDQKRRLLETLLKEGLREAGRGRPR
jgi:type I restriction enzyme, S subunit